LALISMVAIQLVAPSRAVAVLPAPTGVSAAALDGQSVSLSWSPVTGATSYKINRDGVAVAETGQTQFTDGQIEAVGSHSYSIIASAGAANQSAASAAVSVVVPSRPDSPTNFARCSAAAGAPGCVYTGTVVADPDNPDVGGRSLTDGVHGGLTYGDAWQSRNNVNPYSWTIDLGTTKPITEINSTWLQVKDDNVLLPAHVTYAVSTDGQVFDSVGDIDRPAVSAANQIKTYRTIGVNSTARYVKVTVNGTGGWSGIDEIEIRGGAPADSVVPQDPDDPQTSVLRPCMDLADARAYEEWTCSPEGLTGTPDVANPAATVFTPVAPAETVDPGSPSGVTGKASGRQSASAAANSSFPSESIYDAWCENSGRCHSVKDPGRYIGVTKINMAHGYIDSSGIHKQGQFDVVITTNLQGRAARWYVNLYWDSGPSLSFRDMAFTCNRVKDHAVDPDCGNYGILAYPVLKSTSWKWKSKTVSGSYLHYSAAYYAEFEWEAYPSSPGARWIPGLKETDRFKCYGTSDCRF
jgi:hypothetical protein